MDTFLSGLAEAAKTITRPYSWAAKQVIVDKETGALRTSLYDPDPKKIKGRNPLIPPPPPRELPNIWKGDPLVPPPPAAKMADGDDVYSDDMSEEQKRAWILKHPSEWRKIQDFHEKQQREWEERHPEQVEMRQEEEMEQRIKQIAANNKETTNILLMGGLAALALVLFL